MRLRGLVDECAEPRCIVVGEAANASQALVWLATHDATWCCSTCRCRAATAPSSPPSCACSAGAGGRVRHRACQHALQGLRPRCGRLPDQAGAARTPAGGAAARPRSGSPRPAGDGAAAPPKDEGPVIVVSDRGRVIRVPVAEVLYLKAELKYVTLRTAEHTYVLDDSLAELEERLGERFLRVHRNALVARARGARARAPRDRRRGRRGGRRRLGRLHGAGRRVAGGVAAAGRGGARGAGRDRALGPDAAEPADTRLPRRTWRSKISSMDPEPLRKSTGVRRAIAGAVAAIAIGVAGIVWLIGERRAAACDGWGDKRLRRSSTSPGSRSRRWQPRARPTPRSRPSRRARCRCAAARGSSSVPTVCRTRASSRASSAGRRTRSARRAIAAMTASGSPRAQAAALYLRLGRADFSALTRRRLQHRGVPAQSRRSESRDRRRIATRWRDSPRTRAIRRSTLGLTAAARSAKGSSQGACSFINVGQWTYLDPLLADAWIAAAAEARLRKDNAGVEDAMFHVAHAERVDLGFAALAAEILNHVPTDDETLPGLSGLLAQASGIEASRFARACLGRRALQRQGARRFESARNLRTDRRRDDRSLD